MILLRLFYEFFKTGLFAVGGGLATLPFLSALADKTGWYTQSQLMDMLAVSESTPGPIGVNTATYVGFTVAGVPGAIVATLGLVCPSIIIILIVATILNAFRHNRYVESVFRCLRPASVALIAAAGLSVVLETFTPAAGAGFNWIGLALAGVLIVLTHWVPQTKKLHPIVWIGLSALAGILAGM